MRSRVRMAGFAPVAVLAPAAFAVHQLRFMLAFGGGAGAELQRTGHSYLHSLVPWIVLLIALTVGAFLRAAGRALAGQQVAAALHPVAGWPVGAVLRGAGRDLRVAGVPRGAVRDRPSRRAGWDLRLRRLVVDPGRDGVGLVLAGLFHGARWVLDEVAHRRARQIRLRRIARAAMLRPPDVLLPRLAPLAQRPVRSRAS